MAESDADDEISATRPRAGGARPALDEELRVVVIAGPDEGQSLDLTSGTYVVGKHPRCDLVLSDPEVSRHHVELRVDPVGIAVRDLGSTNGSLYHDVRFSEVLVGSGAVITIGNTRLLFARRGAAATLPPSTAERFGRLVGRSRAMRELFAQLERAAASDAPILIQAETGTGKELCAEAIHLASARARGPFVVCDLGAVAASVIESELFGHLRGAFTGAVRDRQGAFEAAEGGTLFLDEIGELALELQPLLLRALENKTIRRVGETRYRRVDVRIIAATNRDLPREVAAGSFREDLWHRLSVVRTSIPPLRERKEDLPLLVAELLPAHRRIAPETLALLAEHDWPGNVRELRNVLERAIALSGADAELLPHALGLERPARAPGRFTRPYHAAREQLLATWERSYLDEVLTRSGGNVSEAARRAGIGRAHLYRLLHKHRLGGVGPKKQDG